MSDGKLRIGFLDRDTLFFKERKSFVIIVLSSKTRRVEHHANFHSSLMCINNFFEQPRLRELKHFNIERFSR